MYVFKVINVSTDKEEPYYCVVYSLNGISSEDADEKVCVPHGNYKKEFCKPYLRTNSSVLQQVDNNLLQNKSPNDVFYSVLEENGGPMYAASPSLEPRNLKQVQNRKYQNKKKVCPTRIPHLNFLQALVSHPLG